MNNNPNTPPNYRRLLEKELNDTRIQGHEKIKLKEVVEKYIKNINLATNELLAVDCDENGTWKVGG